MANVVLGIGSSHGPTIQTPPEQWGRLGAEDEEDTRFDFAALRRSARPGLGAEIRLEKMVERSQACRTAINALGHVIRDAAPDVVVVLSNPHGGVTHDRMQPTFGVYLNDSPPMTERPAHARNRPPQAAAEPRSERELRQFPTDGDLARHLMEELIEAGIDVACSFQSRPGAGLDEAFNVLYREYVPDADLPYVPFLISRYLPNQATPARCYELGRALRRAVESWGLDKRVAIMASGGLSHQVIDEELDHNVIDALTEGNVAQLCSLPRDRLNRAPGTPEILNWVACAGAMEPAPMTLVDYVPCYRSTAGTGHGVTFGYWKPLD